MLLFATPLQGPCCQTVLKLLNFDKNVSLSLLVIYKRVRVLYDFTHNTDHLTSFAFSTSVVLFPDVQAAVF